MSVEYYVRDRIDFFAFWNELDDVMTVLGMLSTNMISTLTRIRDHSYRKFFIAYKNFANFSTHSVINDPREILLSQLDI